MSHKFRFTKESRERMKRFSAGEDKMPDAAESAAPAAPAAMDAPESAAPPKKPEAAAETPASAKAEVKPAENCLTAVCRTDIGRIRHSNQDAVIDAPADRLFGVADGMGGHNGGETASAGARDGLLERLKGKEPNGDVLCAAVGAVNRQLFRRSKEEESLSGMGTTLTVLWFGEETVHIAHVGDSRAYRLRDGELSQVTEDHSVVAELVRSGVLTREQAAVHPMRNVITRAVGTEDGVETDLLNEKRRPGDLWLVCSDGLYGMVPDESMEEILKNNDAEKAADLLVEAALDAGGRDNVSLVLLLDKEGGR